MKKLLTTLCLICIITITNAQQSQPRWQADSLSNSQRIQKAQKLIAQCATLHSFTLAGEAGSALFLAAGIILLPNGGTSQVNNNGVETIYLNGGVSSCFIACGACIIGALACDIASDVKSGHANFFLKEATGQKVSLYQGRNGIGLAYNF